MEQAKQETPQWIRIHPLAVRITHGVNALAIFVMVASGWRIYNAAPLFPFKFPSELTIGGWLGGGLQWHFAAMWLLAINGLVYLGYGFAAGHFKRKLLPITPSGIIADVRDALRGKLAHDDLTVYNTAQRAAYVAIIVSIMLLVLSGLAIWKPVQFHSLTVLMGDYEGARIVHFLAMALMVLIVLVHIAMVALVPRTFPSMFSGRVRSTGAVGRGGQS